MFRFRGLLHDPLREKGHTHLGYTHYEATTLLQGAFGYFFYESMRGATLDLAIRQRIRYF